MNKRRERIAVVILVLVLLGIGTTVPALAAPGGKIAILKHYDAPPVLGIPRGHLPPPGSYRLWIPGRPPGLQPPTIYPVDVTRYAPPGVWVVYRPLRSRYVYVRIIDSPRYVAPTIVHVFDARRGTYVRTEVLHRVRYR